LTRAVSGALLGWLAKYLACLTLTALITLGGALITMLFKDWTLKALATSLLAWPALGLAMILGVPAALLPFGRIYLFSALGGGLLFNLILLLA
jgi:hypothetical protein